MEITGDEINTVWTVVHKLPSIVLLPAQSLVGSMEATNCLPFWPSKKHLPGKWLATDDNLQQALTSWLQTFDTSFLYVTIHALVPWWNKFLNVSGNWWRSDVYHLLPTCPVHIEVEIKFLAFIHSFSILSDDRAKAYSKTVPPHSAI